MSIQETMQILTLVSECYPSFTANRNVQTTATIWQKFFADDPYPVVEAALMAFISKDKHGYAPAIGQIRNEMAIMKPDNGLTEGAAWAMVRKAIGNSLYNSHAEFSKLPPEVQAAVGDPGMLRAWAGMDEDEVNSVIASNFQRSYRAKAEHKRELDAIPQSIRNVFLEFADSLGKIGDGAD